MTTTFHPDNRRADALSDGRLSRLDAMELPKIVAARGLWCAGHFGVDRHTRRQAGISCAVGTGAPPRRRPGAAVDLHAELQTVDSVRNALALITGIGSGPR